MLTKSWIGVAVEMTTLQFEGEKSYRLAITIAKTMLNNNLISKSDFKKIDSMLISKYQPIIG
ncbi:MAG: SHOCT domain-containing protein, partial [archaeon]